MTFKFQFDVVRRETSVDTTGTETGMEMSFSRPQSWCYVTSVTCFSFYGSLDHYGSLRIPENRSRIVYFRLTPFIFGKTGSH